MEATICRSNRLFWSLSGFVVLLLVISGGCRFGSPGRSTFREYERRKDPARQLIERSGLQGGMIVHIGSDDGGFTAALRVGEQYVVQGLEGDPEKVERSRDFIRSLGLYGPVSTVHWNGGDLPYVDNLVNLILAEDPGETGMEEMLRVLAPGGVVFVKKADQWMKRVKAWPDAIDEWSHYLHGPDNNAVARDQMVGPPELTQWISGPPFSRSHEVNSSLAAMVTAGGRLFYIWDEGPLALADPRFPQKWSLLARDAFNGMLLWKIPVPEWGWTQWHSPDFFDDPLERGSSRGRAPVTLPRRLVASDNRVYVTLGYTAPVTVLDAATGKTIRVFDETEMTDEILLDDGVLILRVRIPESPPETDFGYGKQEMPLGRVMAVDAETGRRLWQSEPEAITTQTLATAGGRVFYSNYKEIVCLERASGEELWRSGPVKSGFDNRRTYGGTLVADGDVVLYTPRPGSTRAFSAVSGRLLWSGPANRGPSGGRQTDLFVADGLAWLGETRMERLGGDREMVKTEVDRQGFDLMTGKVVREISVPYLLSPGHHYRCYPSKATENYLLLPKRGVEFLDIRGDGHARHDWLRPPCAYGVLPANGILYMAPHQCVCYPGVLLPNFNALVSGTARGRGSGLPEPVRLLERGPAYGRQARRVEAGRDDWPVYRRDGLRSGSTGAPVTGSLEKRWETELGGRITPPVVAGGRLYVAQKDAHTVHALDAVKGRRLWQYTTGGRVDSPPAVHGPYVLFGSSDGWVYCLWAGTGELVWRFLAAPNERQVSAFGQFESAWPVNGSVLVEKDATASPSRPVVYFAAGRSSFLDGGIRIYGLDPASGKVLHQASLEGPDSDPFRDIGTAGYMDGSLSGILVSDGADLYLYQNRFRGDLEPVEAPMQNLRAEGGGYRIFTPAPERGSPGKHLIPTAGFLDDSFNEGTFWTYSEKWPGWTRVMGGVPFFGQLLVFDDLTVYGVNYYYERIRVRRGIMPGKKGYRIFARSHNADEDTWSVFVPVRTQAMVLADDRLFFAGTPDLVPEEDPLAALEGRLGGVLWVVSADTGEKLAVYKLNAPPVFDGLIAMPGKLFISTTDGYIVCLAG